MDRLNHGVYRRLGRGTHLRRSVLAHILESRKFSGALSLLPEEKLALSLSLLLLVAALVIFL